MPEYLGSGSLLRAAERARQPNPDSAAFAASPFLEVFRRSASVLTVPVYAGAVVAVVLAAWRRREPFAGVVVTLAALSTTLMVAVALMTEAGFAGNLRYVALPAAMVCVLAGAGWVGLVRLLAGAGPRGGRACSPRSRWPPRRRSRRGRRAESRHVAGPGRVGVRPLRAPTSRR